MENFVVDASVILKWLNDEGEESLDLALDILKEAKQGNTVLFAPELVASEVGNALVRGKKLRGEPLRLATTVFWELPLALITIDRWLTETAAFIAQEKSISFYDASYLAVAYNHRMPLISANVKHHKSFGDITVIPLSEWVV